MTEELSTLEFIRQHLLGDFTSSESYVADIFTSFPDVFDLEPESWDLSPSGSESSSLVLDPGRLDSPVRTLHVLNSDIDFSEFETKPQILNLDFRAPSGVTSVQSPTTFGEPIGYSSGSCPVPLGASQKRHYRGSAGARGASLLRRYGTQTGRGLGSGSGHMTLPLTRPELTTMRHSR
ncbi:hypothetical protein NMG60_11012177 [Bertholletia excelsa]